MRWMIEKKSLSLSTLNSIIGNFHVKFLRGKISLMSAREHEVWSIRSVMSALHWRVPTCALRVHFSPNGIGSVPTFTPLEGLYRL